MWGVISTGPGLEQPLPPDTEARLASFTELVATAIANAESRAELMASRARIVAAADDTRRRIERDLHPSARPSRTSATRRWARCPDPLPASGYRRAAICPDHARAPGSPSRPPADKDYGGRPTFLGWAAGDTVGSPETPRERAGGLDLPAAQRLSGQFFERAAALALPEDRDQDAGDERARNRDQPDPAQRRGRGEDRSAEEDAPQAPRWPTPSVQPVPSERIRVG